MDKANLKNIEIHLSEKVQTSLIEALKYLKSTGKLTPNQLVTLEQIAAENGEGSGRDAFKNKKAPEKGSAKQVGDSQHSQVVRDSDRARVYSRLLSEGGRKQGKAMEQKLFAILNEVQHAEAQGKSNPAPVPNTEFDEKFFAKPHEELNAQEEGDAPQEDDDDDQAGDEENNEEGESLSLKETDPGYFKSLLVII